MAISRRRIFENMALAGMAATAAQAAQEKRGRDNDEHGGGQLPNFKYDLEAQTHWTGEGGSAKEATVAEFPISQSIAGVSMRLKPGAMRELHWHSLAAEWAYMLAGRCRVTVINPEGQAEVADFEVGDTWYFPRGHGHSLQGLGPGECHFLLGFDNGHFSEFGTFSVTDWIASTPPNIVARNLNLSAAEVARLPRKEVYIGTGRVPPAALPAFRNGDLQPAQFSHKYRLLDQAADKVRWRYGARSLVARVSDSNHPDCGAARSRTGRIARNALASARRRVAILHSRPRACRHLRIARPGPHGGVRSRKRRVHSSRAGALR